MEGKSLKKFVNRLPRHARFVPQERDTHSFRTDRSDIGLNTVGQMHFDEAAPWRNAKMLAYPESTRAARCRLQSGHRAQPRMETICGSKESGAH